MVLMVWNPFVQMQEKIGEWLRHTADREQVRIYLREGEYDQAIDYAREHGYSEGFVREQADTYARNLADRLASSLSNWMSPWEDERWERVTDVVDYFNLEETEDYVHEKAKERMGDMLDRTGGMDGKTRRAQKDIAPSSLPVDREDAKEYVNTRVEGSSEDDMERLIDAFDRH